MTTSRTRSCRDFLAFFSGRRSVAIVAAGMSLVLSLVLFFVWPLVFTGLVAFGEFILTLGPVGVGIYGFLNRLLIPLGLHHALNSVFWFDVAGINDLGNFLHATGTYGVTGQYMTGFFPVMMLGLPGAALAMYVTAKSARRKVAAGVLFSSAIASFFVGVTEPLEFSFMFLAPGLYVVHALFTGISMGISALLPVRMGFGFSGGFIDLVLGWVNPMAQNPWAIPLMGIFWFVVYFVVFRAIILKFDLKTPGRDEDDQLTDDGVTLSGENGSTSPTATAFLTALGGKENIIDLENCATRLRMEVADTTVIDEAALKRAGAAGTMKPGRPVGPGHLRHQRPVREGRDGVDHHRQVRARRRGGGGGGSGGRSDRCLGTAGPAADGGSRHRRADDAPGASASAPGGQCRPAVRGPRSDVRAGGHGPGRRDRSHRW